MKFEIAEKRQNTAKAVFDMYIDGDGDCNVSINGIDVLYIKSDHGTIRRYVQDEVEQKKLENLGFTFGRDGRLKTGE